MTVLVYSLSLVLLSSFIKASKCESLAEDVSHPLARTADRLVTVTALWVFFRAPQSTHSRSATGFLLYVSSGEQHARIQVRCSGGIRTRCIYGCFYLSSLGLVGRKWSYVENFSSEKLTMKTCSGRIMNINIISILLIMSAYMIAESMGVLLIAISSAPAHQYSPGASAFRSLGRWGRRCDHK